jgi:hypothetical protein
MRKEKCSKCGKSAVLGVDAVVDDRDGVLCDQCAEVVRDGYGYAWLPGQVRMNLVDPDTKKLAKSLARPK